MSEGCKRSASAGRGTAKTGSMSISKLSRGRRTFGIVDLFGVGALDQTIKIMMKEPEKFRAAFTPGLSRAGIAEAPIAALDILRDTYKQGAISDVDLEAKVASIFPQEAARAVLAFVQASDERVAEYEGRYPPPLTGAALERRLDKINDLILDCVHAALETERSGHQDGESAGLAAPVRPGAPPFKDPKPTKARRRS